MASLARASFSSAAFPRRGIGFAFDIAQRRMQGRHCVADYCDAVGSCTQQSKAVKVEHRLWMSAGMKTFARSFRPFPSLTAIPVVGGIVSNALPLAERKSETERNAHRFYSSQAMNTNARLYAAATSSRRWRVAYA